MGQMQKRGYHTVARPTSTPCPSTATRAFSSSPEYTEVTQVLDRIRGVTSPKIAKKVDAIFVFNVEGEGKFHVDLKIGNEVSVGEGKFHVDLKIGNEVSV